MINEIKRTYKASSQTNKVNEITTSIYYNKGGANYFTGRTEERGYYFSITPEENDGYMVLYQGFSGIKTCILPVNRQSKKSYDIAKNMMDKYIELYLNDFCKENGYDIIEKENYKEREFERSA